MHKVITARITNNGNDCTLRKFQLYGKRFRYDETGALKKNSTRRSSMKRRVASEGNMFLAQHSRLMSKAVLRSAHI